MKSLLPSEPEFWNSSQIKFLSYKIDFETALKRIHRFSWMNTYYSNMVLRLTSYYELIDILSTKEFEIDIKRLPKFFRNLKIDYKKINGLKSVIVILFNYLDEINDNKLVKGVFNIQNLDKKMEGILQDVKILNLYS